MSGLIRTWKESEAARGTHQLKITERDTYQDMESKLEKHPYFLNRTKEGLLGHGKREPVKYTHLLERAEIKIG